MAITNSLKKKSGQTLIEAVVTLLIIGIGVIALIRFQNYLSYDNSLVKQKADATTLAMQRVENLIDFQTLNDLSGYSSYQSIASGTSSSTLSGTAYTITWTVTSYTNPTYKTIDVVVSWTDIRNTAQSVRIITNTAGIDPGNSSTVM